MPVLDRSEVESMVLLSRIPPPPPAGCCRQQQFLGRSKPLHFFLSFHDTFTSFQVVDERRFWLLLLIEMLHFPPQTFNYVWMCSVIGEKYKVL